MRKIDDLANKLYEGDIKRAIYETVYSENRNINDYLSELDKDELYYALTCLEEKAINKAGGTDNYIKDIKMNHLLESLELSEEEVLNMQKNPYRKKLGKTALIILVGFVLFVVFFIVNKFVNIVREENIVLVFLLFVIYYTLSFAVNDIVFYRKYKKAKKLVMDKNSRMNNK